MLHLWMESAIGKKNYIQNGIFKMVSLVQWKGRTECPWFYSLQSYIVIFCVFQVPGESVASTTVE